MNESYKLLFTKQDKVCIVLPSLELSEERLQKRLTKSDYVICFVNYSGFGSSDGSFPGKNIIENIDRLMEEVKKETGKRVTRIIGDSFGGLIALGLLSRYKKRYSKITIILISPLISFKRLDKNPKSPQSKEGFVRYLRDHILIKEVNYTQLSNLIDHIEIPEPFTEEISQKNVVIYHSYGDKSISFVSSEKFSKKNKIKLVKLKGKAHSLINMDNKLLTKMFDS